jgi:mannitol/fructose-specific phosphotransferase system IIA component
MEKSAYFQPFLHFFRALSVLVGHAFNVPHGLVRQRALQRMVISPQARAGLSRIQSNTNLKNGIAL